MILPISDDKTGRLRTPYVNYALIALNVLVFLFLLGDNPFIPSLGASGAISGVMGGYLVLHPHRRVRSSSCAC